MGDSAIMITFDEVHRLIKHGDLVSLGHELDEGLSPSLSNRSSWTLLMLAAIEGNTAIGELLVSRGAELDALNDFGETALSLAALGGHTRFLQILLANGASTDCRPHGHNLKDWLEVASGLPQDKVVSILDLINNPRLDQA
jgi:ankyrin repeat protein